MTFLEEKLAYYLSILIINFINYIKEGTIEIFAFALLIFSKSSIISNISVFEDFNIQ